MKKKMNRMLWIVPAALISCLALASCRPKNAAEPGIGQRTGAAIDRAADKTVEKTGEVMEKAGAAVEKTGTDMQK
ncbi:MAG: hypothetical protein GX617_00350 [Lentisphaerae bacterium]|jgi:hypothetical protein|nr:hypothetical protein [Lentisphaerota bacterium]